MIKLDEEHRKSCYYFAISYLKTGEYRFICTALRKAISVYYNKQMHIKDTITIFPELDKYLPLNSKDRLDVLTDCIKDLNDGKEK